MDLPDRFNLADHLLTSRLEAGDGDRIALRGPAGNHTYAEVAAAAAGWQTALVQAGVRQEERVLLGLPDGPGFAAALFGILAAGAVVVMVNPDQPAERLSGLVRYVRPTAAVVSTSARPAFAEASGLAEVPLRLLTTDDAASTASGGPASASGGDVSASPASASGDPASASPATGNLDADVIPTGWRPVPTHPDDPAIWLFSGGTTGLPKAVVQTHRSFANTTALYAQRTVGYRPDDVTISVPKLYFGYATGSNLFFPFSVGASAVLFPDHPTPQRLFDLIAEHRATILVNVPSMMQQMLDAPTADAADLSSLRFATSAGEALPPALHDRWKQTFKIPVYDGLGTAEMWHIFVTNGPDGVRPGTVGRAVDGFRVEVRDDDGHPVPDGQVGNLWVAGDSRAIAYWRNMAKTKEVFRGEWVVTGDLVSRDAEGYVTYVGRGDDAMKVKGKWLVPSEVEGVLMEHPAVTGAVVIGVDDAAGLTKPVAFVTVDRGAAGDDDGLVAVLRQHCLDRLDAYKHPREIRVVDDLPRTHLGKVDRGALRRLAE